MFQSFWHVDCGGSAKPFCSSISLQRRENQFIIINQQNLDQAHWHTYCGAQSSTIPQQ
jgi:hypothetical protein